MKFPVFQYVPLPLLLSLDTTEESGTIFYTSFHKVLIHMDEIPLETSLLEAKQSQLSQPILPWQVLQSPNPLITHYCTHSSMSTFLLNWGTQNWTCYSGCFISAEEKRRIISLNLLTVLFIVQPWRVLATFVACVQYWLMFNLSTRTPRSFSERKDRKDNLVTSSVLPLVFLTLHTWLRALAVGIRLFLDNLG